MSYRLEIWNTAPIWITLNENVIKEEDQRKMKKTKKLNKLSDELET